MEKFTIVFTVVFDSCKVGIIKEFSSNPARPSHKHLCLLGWYAPTLKDAYRKYTKNREGDLIYEIEHCGCAGFSQENEYINKYIQDIMYEIPEEEVLKLIKIEELTGGL